MSKVGGVLLPAGVLEKIPFLKEQRSLFFDFGMQHPASASSTQLTQPDPIVVVITDTSTVIAPYPRPTRATKIIQHHQLAGVSRDEEKVRLHCAGDEDVLLALPKAETFVVYLVDIQDRNLGKSLHFHAAAKQEEDPQTTSISTSEKRKFAPNNRNSNSRAPKERTLSERTLKVLNRVDNEARVFEEWNLGAFRLGYASHRSKKPPKELEEGSDATSVQTLEQEELQDSAAQQQVLNLASVSIDPFSIHRRLFYFFQQYDRAKLPFIEAMIAQYKGRETQLLRELELAYGPEPSKIRWEIRDQIAHQREINLQLKAQLKRAQDELLLLNREDDELADSVDRVLQQKERFLKELRGQELSTTVPPAPSRPRSRLQLFEFNVGTDLSRRAFFITTVHFFVVLKQQVATAAGATTFPLCTITNRSRMDIAPVTANCRFVAGWALEYGPYAVAILPAKEKCKEKDADQSEQKIFFVAAEKFWRSYVEIVN